jgi:RNA polymerase sigma factor (TIGR02999 family)
MAESVGDVTQMLISYGAGKREVLDSLLPLVYDELRRIAGNYLSRERNDHTLQPTALVHETYLRLVNQQSVDWRNRAQFYGLAAQMMRRILVNHAESRRAEKRGGGAQKVSLDDVTIFFNEQNLDLLALDEALKRLAEFDEDKAQIVEMKFFGGMTIPEIAEITNRSTATVEREWAFARGWLFKMLTAGN